jgi:hypothetical protein
VVLLSVGCATSADDQFHVFEPVDAARNERPDAVARAEKMG